MCEFELPDVSLRCFVARQLLLRIYALSSVKFSGLKSWLCKICDKYEVCQNHADVKQKSGWQYVRLSGQICQIIKWELWTRENSNFWVSHGLNGSLLSEFAFAYMLWSFTGCAQNNDPPPNLDWTVETKWLRWKRNLFCFRVLCPSSSSLGLTIG